MQACRQAGLPLTLALSLTHTRQPQDFDTPDALLAAIAANDPEVSPSLLYATAACLEGCSFVNGGSQNTLCPALAALAREHKSYVLGTDFKVRSGLPPVFCLARMRAFLKEVDRP